MPTYELATKAVCQQVTRLMKRYHSELSDAGVTCDVLMAYAKTDANGDPRGPAINHGGYACMATVRIIGTKERAAGRKDVEILLDGDRWTELATEEQDAVIDHELEHLELQVGDDGLKRDDLDRPRLRIRKHDHQFGWFDSIVRRHGRDSIEFQQYEQFHEFSYTQLWLPGIEEPIGKA